MTEPAATAEAIVRLSQEKPTKPILTCFLGADKVEKGVKILRQSNRPHIDAVESAVEAAKVMADYARWRRQPKRVVKLFPVNRRKVENIIERHLRHGTREVAENESKEILEAYGFVTPKGSIATTAEQAAGIAEQLGFPVVLKIWSPDILHKSDVDGVQIGLTSTKAVKDAFDLMMYRIPKKLPNADILGRATSRKWCRGERKSFSACSAIRISVR